MTKHCRTAVVLFFGFFFLFGRGRFRVVVDVVERPSGSGEPTCGVPARRLPQRRQRWPRLKAPKKLGNATLDRQAKFAALSLWKVPKKKNSHYTPPSSQIRCSLPFSFPFSLFHRLFSFSFFLFFRASRSATPIAFGGHRPHHRSSASPASLASSRASR